MPADPLLTGLSVSGSKTLLNPAFESNVLRYSVIADDTATGISVTANAGDSLIISINGSIVASGTEFMLDPLAQGETVDISVQTQSGRREEQIVQRDQLAVTLGQIDGLDDHGRVSPVQGSRLAGMRIR